MGTTTSQGRAPETSGGQPGRNEVVLQGRLSADPEQRELPSGDLITTMRVVVPRPPASRTAGKAARASFDTIDVVCWNAAPRRSAGKLKAGDTVEIHGALHRRFFAVGGTRTSRYEVAARTIKRVVGVGPPAS